MTLARNKRNRCAASGLVELRDRGWFQNHCRNVRLLKLPARRDLRSCLAGSRGRLTVLHGWMEIENGGPKRLPVA